MLCTEPTYILVVMARRKHPVCVHAYNIAQITARGGTNMHYVDWRVMFLVVGGFNRACGMQIPTCMGFVPMFHPRFQPAAGCNHQLVHRCTEIVYTKKLDSLLCS